MKLQKRLNLRRGLREKRTRIKVRGTSSKPRLSVFRSNRFIYAQLIDDQNGKTLAFVSDKSLVDGLTGKRLTKSQRAMELGKLIAKKANEMKVERAVFDKGSYQYHGRVKMVADGAREGGLKF